MAKHFLKASGKYCLDMSSSARKGGVESRRYWEVYYDLDFEQRPSISKRRFKGLLEESVALNLRSDVPVGAYVSGGLDSSIVASLAAHREGAALKGFTGKFSFDQAYDESRYAA